MKLKLAETLLCHRGQKQSGKGHSRLAKVRAQPSAGGARHGHRALRALRAVRHGRDGKGGGAGHCGRERSPRALYDVLREKFAFEEKNTGIAFTVPVKSVGGPATLALLAGSIAAGGEV